ncbi:MAG: hypothetical protein K0Q55_2042 [Verrucomicrobia bacterium]|jgi:hypothetical protein|nr:hypothetical protein [Verrucomicrobiota bacterium]
MKFAVHITGLLLASLISLHAQGTEEYEQAPIRYSATASKDATQKLEAKLAAGKLALPATDKDMVRLILKEMNVPVESQVLVYSKTSLQRGLIAPKHPRAIYFNDDCYIGWVPGGLMEVVSFDPQLGPVFYTFDPRPLPKPDLPRFKRDNDCLSCHGGSFVRGIPGVLIRSVNTDANGDPLLQFGSKVVDHTTPFKDRWGGWYVTGTHGDSVHQGNVFASGKDRELSVDYSKGANITDLSRFFPVENLLTDSSDIVALLVLEHQTAMHNSITRAAYNARRMLAYQHNLQTDLKEKVTPEPSYDSVKRVFDSSAQDVVDHLLYKDEAVLPEDGVKGDSGFQEAYERVGIRTKDGRSLRELRLDRYLFKYRCSHLIYSKQFLALPAPLKQRIYTRLEKALDADNPDSRYDYLSKQERLSITEILRETHPELKTLWALQAVAK